LETKKKSQVKEVQWQRRLHLSVLATTPEEQQTFKGNAIQAKAAFEAVQQQVAQAEIDLNRTQVRSPVNGYATNLLLRVGDYAHQGVSNVSIIDADSYWVDGYFEETQIARVCVGDGISGIAPGAASPASERQPEPPPYIDEPFSERFDQPIIVIGRLRNAQPFGAARDGRKLDRLDVDAVLGKQKTARSLLFSHHHQARQKRNDRRPWPKCLLACTRW
jgi:multidrug efflux pump subunit AcrA (membrane-fusion protein)